MKNRKRILLLLSLVFLLVVGAGATVAYIATNTQNITNTFEATEVACKINETVSNKAKKNVTIENSGSIDAFIRAEVVVTWKKRAEDGSFVTFGIVPVKSTDGGETGDYVITGMESGWSEGSDGFYYYRDVVPAGEKTDKLFEVCKVGKNAAVPENYFLSVEIIAEAIQADGQKADGTKPVTEAWGMYVDKNGQLTPTAPSEDN